MFSSRHCSKNVVANTYYVPVAKGQDFATNNHVFPPLRLSEENENKLSTSEIVKSFPSPQHEAYSSPSPKKTSDVNNSIFQIYRDKKFDLPAHLYQSNSVEHIQKRRVDGQQRLPLFLPSFPPYSVMSSPVTMHPTISPHPIFALRRPHDTTIASKELNNAPILLLSSPLPPSPPGSFALPKKTYVIQTNEKQDLPPTKKEDIRLHFKYNGPSNFAIQFKHPLPPSSSMSMPPPADVEMKRCYRKRKEYPSAFQKEKKTCIDKNNTITNSFSIEKSANYSGRSHRLARLSCAELDLRASLATTCAICNQKLDVDDHVIRCRGALSTCAALVHGICILPNLQRNFPFSSCQWRCTSCISFHTIWGPPGSMARSRADPNIVKNKRNDQIEHKVLPLSITN